jgi:hypothetical protein
MIKYKNIIKYIKSYKNLIHIYKTKMMTMGDMTVTSVLAGFLSTMNMWVYRLDDARFHLNDVYMVLLMTCWMMLFTLFTTWDGYNSMSTENTNAICFFIFMIGLIIYCIRNQILITDEQYLNGMIPHHSMAILMSKKIKEKTKNNKIKTLASNIIESQEREIKLMNDILKEL